MVFYFFDQINLLYKIINKYINFNTILSFNISIDIINNSIDYVYKVYHNMKNIIKLMTIDFLLAEYIMLLLNNLFIVEISYAFYYT